MSEKPSPSFTEMTNLAAGRLGAEAVEANDEFFAEKENLVAEGRGIFIPDKYTENGKWMDGWETRRRREPGHDWCIVRLARPGKIFGFDVDTNHFLGNHPPECSIEMWTASGWEELVPRSPLDPGSQNFFAVDPTTQSELVEQVRLNIFPDGGVARLKVYGEIPFSGELGKTTDLASILVGGRVLGCNDMFFSSKDNLIMPGRGKDMGDGWETKRRREPGHDWVILKLAAKGTLEELEVDTCHFKGNYPDRVSLEGLVCDTDSSTEELAGRSDWQEILPESKLTAHMQHIFKDLAATGPFTHIRMNIFPDGGISRLRVVGKPV